MRLSIMPWLFHFLTFLDANNNLPMDQQLTVKWVRPNAVVLYVDSTPLLCKIDRFKHSFLLFYVLEDEDNHITGGICLACLPFQACLVWKLINNKIENAILFQYDFESCEKEILLSIPPKQNELFSIFLHMPIIIIVS